MAINLLELYKEMFTLHATCPNCCSVNRSIYLEQRALGYRTLTRLIVAYDSDHFGTLDTYDSDHFGTLDTYDSDHFGTLDTYAELRRY